GRAAYARDRRTAGDGGPKSGRDVDGAGPWTGPDGRRDWGGIAAQRGSDAHVGRPPLRTESARPGVVRAGVAGMDTDGDAGELRSRAPRDESGSGGGAALGVGPCGRISRLCYPPSDMGDIRDKAKEILSAVPEPPAVITSDGKTHDAFTRLTGTSHKTMKANWDKGGYMTACNGFVGWYGATLGSKVYLGGFDLEGIVKKAGKGHSYVKSTADNGPKYGD